MAVELRHMLPRMLAVQPQALPCRPRTLPPFTALVLRCQAGVVFCRRDPVGRWRASLDFAESEIYALSTVAAACCAGSASAA